jgi:NitT/TauT family transport system permease protein
MALRDHTTTLRYLVSVSVFPFGVLLNEVLPDALNRPGQPHGVLNGFFLLLFLLLGGYLLYGHFLKRQHHATVYVVMNTSLLFGSFFVLWLVLVGKWGMLHPHSFPSPNHVFDVYVTDWEFLTYESSRASIQRAATGYLLALIPGVILGILCGRRRRIFEVTYPLSKVTACIPPIVYLPYAVAIMPSLDVAILFIIFVGAFWPIFINTMFGVYNLDPTFEEFARTLGADDRRILRKVILPGAMPSILAGCLIGLVLAFVLLTAGEMVGANRGLGFYLMYHADIGYFDKVVASMLLLSFWVFFWITFAFDIVQAWLLRWQRKIGG